jgi:hypothetical protein
LPTAGRAEVLTPFAGEPVAEGAATLIWDPSWNKGRGRLTARFADTVSPEIVSKAMHDLIGLTRAKVQQRVRDLGGQ